MDVLVALGALVSEIDEQGAQLGGGDRAGSVEVELGEDCAHRRWPSELVCGRRPNGARGVRCMVTTTCLSLAALHMAARLAGGRSTRADLAASAAESAARPQALLVKLLTPCTLSGHVAARVSSFL